jgi:hypothetical protein
VVARPGRLRHTAAVAATLLGCLGWTVACSNPHHSSVPPTSRPAIVTGFGHRPSTVPRAGRSSADLHIASGFSAVQITADPVGADLVQASGPADATLQPVVTVTGNSVTITQPQGGPGLPVLIVKVSTAVTWQLSLDGGATTASVDLRAGRLRRLDVTQGVSSLTISLPAPAGTVLVDLAAGASQVVLRVPGSAPARATLAGGAGTVTLYDERHTGVAGGSVFETTGWTSARDRLDVTCSAGVSALVVQGA